jgi:hypothetical protein
MPKEFPEKTEVAKQMLFSKSRRITQKRGSSLASKP